jgi:hypothetical protein
MLTNQALDRTASQSTIAAGSDDAAPETRELVLKAVIVYDSSGAGQHAIELLQRLEESGPRIRFSLSAWRFDSLARHVSKYHAFDDVVDADLVILSLSVPHSIPDLVTSWLTTCLQRKEGRPGDVLLLSGGDTWSAKIRLRDGMLAFEDLPADQRMVA